MRRSLKKNFEATWVLSINKGTSEFFIRHDDSPLFARALK
jgi:hypothetical protein